MKKHLRYFAALAVALLATAGCVKDDEPVTELFLSKTSIQAGMEGEKVTVSLRTNTAWTISAIPDWVEVSPGKGNGDAEIGIEIKKNPSTASRSCILAVKTTNGNVMRALTVKQDGGKAGVDNIVIAHRGAYKEYSLPDNSLAALKKAIELGCYGSECDINVTLDGQAVVSHSGSFKGKYIKDCTYEDLRKSGTLSNGEELPLLRTFIQAVQKGNGTKLFLDVKSLSDAEGGNAQSIKAGVAAAKLVKEMGAQDLVCFIVGRLDVYKGTNKELMNACPIAYMNQDLTPAKFISNTGGGTWGNFEIGAFGKGGDGNFNASVAESKLKEWNAAGVELSFYNIDTEAQTLWWLLHKDEVKGCTNYPYRLLKRLGLRD